MMKMLRRLALATVLGTFALPAAAELLVEVDVDGLACEFCIYGLEKRLEDLDGVTDAEVSLKLKKVRIHFTDEATLDEALIRKAVKDAGFTPKAIHFPDKTV